jgi:hypothetical protein
LLIALLIVAADVSLTLEGTTERIGSRSEIISSLSVTIYKAWIPLNESPIIVSIKATVYKFTFIIDIHNTIEDVRLCVDCRHTVSLLVVHGYE